MQQTEVSIHSSTALRQTMKNRFLSPVTGVFRKRFLTTCLTTDSRGVCGNSGVKSCEEHPQQSKSGYKAPEKVEKFLFKSLGARCRESESPISDQDVLMKDATWKTPHKSAVFLYLCRLFSGRKVRKNAFFGKSVFPRERRHFRDAAEHSIMYNKGPVDKVARRSFLW